MTVLLIQCHERYMFYGWDEVGTLKPRSPISNARRAEVALSTHLSLRMLSLSILAWIQHKCFWVSLLRFGLVSPVQPTKG